MYLRNATHSRMIREIEISVSITSTLVLRKKKTTGEKIISENRVVNTEYWDFRTQ